MPCRAAWKAPMWLPLCLSRLLHSFYCLFISCSVGRDRALVILVLINYFLFHRKRPQNKMKKSPVGSWRSFFNLGKSSSVSKRKLQRNESEPSEMKAMALKGKH
jgi:hypothetical protein